MLFSDVCETVARSYDNHKGHFDTEEILFLAVTEDEANRKGPTVPNTERSILLVGKFERSHRDALVAACSRAKMTPYLATDFNEYKLWQEKSSPRVIVLQSHLQHAEDICLHLRANPKLSLVPILALADTVTDLTFAELYGWGGDDVVLASDADSFERRLRLLPEDLPMEAADFRGIALVADSDNKRRLLMARMLRNAGFDLRFAVNTDELVKNALAPDLTIVIADLDLGSVGAISALKQVRSAGNSLPWVLSAAPSKHAATGSEVSALAPVVIHDAFAPLENMLFVANEALKGSFGDRRSSPRLLYGASALFRSAGRETDHLGYVYNICAEGLFIRTMDPLPQGEEIWLELTPPRTDRRVRLEARVVWRRLFGPVHGATAPPGFGLRINGGSKAELERFHCGYTAFAKDMVGWSFSVRPPKP
jgi:DNA-binding response OmpR family regulator/Tfp pilus assembly protein PilZ